MGKNSEIGEADAEINSYVHLGEEKIRRERDNQKKIKAFGEEIFF